VTPSDTPLSDGNETAGESQGKGSSLSTVLPIVGGGIAAAAIIALLAAYLFRRRKREE
jgi:hypothetical protein